MLITLLTVLLLLTVIILLVLITVFQHGNEGGFGSALGGGNSSGFFGASGGANIIVRATWVFGSLFFLLSTALAWVRTHDSFSVGRELESVIDDPALKDLEEKPAEAGGSSDSAPGETPDSQADGATGDGTLPVEARAPSDAPAENDQSPTPEAPSEEAKP